MKNPKRKFLKLPEYPGGKEAFKKYIKSNMIYPPEALKNKTEGIVHISAFIDDNGHASDITVEKGVGDGCDEEAVRLIKKTRFGGAKNRGVRLKTRKKFKIEFKLPEQQKITYQLTSSSTKKPKDDTPAKTYSYTVKLK